MNTKAATLGVLLLLVGVAPALSAQAPKPGSKLPDGRTFLYREKVEIYWNDWTGVRVKAGSQTDVHISSEGKTADFDGTLSLNCESGSGYLWKNASNFREQLSEKQVNILVPLQVIATAKKLFCR